MSGADAPKVRTFPPLIYLAGLVIGHLANRWLQVDAVPVDVAWIVGGILLVLGLGLIASAMMNFTRAGTTIRPDRASSSLVIAGPYKFTRNPMYVGMATAYLGLAIADRIARQPDPPACRSAHHPARGDRQRRGISRTPLRQRLHRLQGEGPSLAVTAYAARLPTMLTNRVGR